MYMRTHEIDFPMTPPFVADPSFRPGVGRPAQAAAAHPARDLYFALSADLDGAAGDAQAWLRGQIEAVREIPSDLPPTLAALPAWVQERTDAVGAQYREYLAARKQGAPRRYFSSRAHALYFLGGVA